MMLHDDDEDAGACTRERSLARIARALNVPVAAFHGSGGAMPPLVADVAPPDDGVVQALAVMRLFLRLRDPEARARCVAFIARELTDAE